MELMVDTSILIATEKGQVDFDIFAKCDGARMSVITITELLVGVHRANTEEKRLKRAAFVEHIIQNLPALPFQEEEARIHAQICSAFLNQGLIIGRHDLIIAATAVCHGYPLLTLNYGAFSRVPGLKVLSPEG